MGLCLSRCGEAHQKAAVVAASISTHGSSPSDPEHDPNHSLKKFLHLYDAVDKKTSTSGSARPSLEDSGSLGIPHSSELFSLHGEDSDSNSNRNSSSSPCNSPPRTSKGSAVSRSSISSRPNISSPHSTRNSVSARITAGRSSTDRPPLAPKGGMSNSKKRGSASSEDFNARKIFVETIAKLERFCNLEVSRVSQTSVGAEQIAQKLVVGLASFDQEDGPNHVGVQRCDSDPLGINSRGGLESAHSLIRSSSVASFKGLPYEKSVACFLREMETLVSTIEASGGLVAQSEVNPIPVAEVEEEAGAEEPRSMTRLPSLRFKEVDEKVQFTEFEASFDYSDGQSLLDVQVLVEEELNRHADGSSTSTAIANKPEKDASEASNMATCSACDLVEEATAENVALQDPNSQAEDISDWVEINISSSASEEDQKAEKKPEAFSSRPALTDLNVNIAVAHEAPAPKKSPSKMRPFKALRRGMSKSLDLKECSVGFDAFKRERLQVAKDQKSNIVQATKSKREEITGQGADKFAPENPQCGEAKVATPEQESIAASEREAQEIENPGTAQSSQSNNIMAGVISPFDLRLIQDLSSVPGHQRLEKPGSLDGYEGGSLMWASSAGTIDLQNDSDSKRFLTKALGNILKLLHSPNGEFTRCSGKLLELLEAESATMESTSTPQGSPAPGPSPVAGEDHDQDVGEDDDGDATLACEQDRWHDAPASLISTFNMEKLESKEPVPM